MDERSQKRIIMNDEEKLVSDLWEQAKKILPTICKIPSDTVLGKHLKRYEYGNSKEIIVENYENGAILYNDVTGQYEWFDKIIRKECFEKAKLLKDRYNYLNRMLR
jgi:hypothetical protein